MNASTVALQWATGGLLFAWVTGRGGLVGLGYSWLVRGVYGGLAVVALVAGVIEAGSGTAAVVRNVAAGAVALVAFGAFAWSFERRSDPRAVPPFVDLVAVAFGVVGVAAAASVIGVDGPLAVVRLASGVLLMGAVTDAMLLGHWYLVQPGLSRGPIRELIAWCAGAWALSFVLWALPEGGVQIITGVVDDGWSGLLGWTWLVCALTTGGLIAAAWFALREPSYSAVMAVTGLLYLAIMTAFGMDLLPRAILTS